MAVVDIVTFDVWNTLLRLEPMWGFISEGIAESTGKSVDEVLKAIVETRSYVKKRVGFIEEDHLSYALRLLSSRLGVGVDSIRSGVARGIVKALLHAEELLFPDTLVGLRAAREASRFVGVVGNTLLWPSSYTRLLLERLGVSSYIDVYSFADEVGYYKPDPRIWRTLFESLNLNEPVCVHVGDSLREDLAGAMAAGCRAVLISRGSTTKVYKDVSIAVASLLSNLRDVISELVH